jgi:hypothetical protein
MSKPDAASLLAAGRVRVDAGLSNGKRFRPVAPRQLVTEGGKPQ